MTRHGAKEELPLQNINKTRYSFGSFIIQREGVEMESPLELESVGEKAPKVYKPLSNTVYVNFFFQGDQNQDDASKKA